MNSMFGRKKMDKVRSEHLVVSERKETIKHLGVVLKRFRSQHEGLSLAKDETI